MNRPYTPLMRDLLAALKTAGATQQAPITQTAAYAAGRKLLANSHQIAAALAALVVDGALTTRTDTVASVTEIKYWISSTPPTKEEKTMSIPKNLWLLQTITKHPGESGAQLSARAEAAGINIPPKNVTGLLAGYVQKGEVIKEKNQANTYVYRAAAAPATTETKEDPALPAAPAHLLRQVADLEAENARLTNLSKTAEAQLDAARADLRVADTHLIAVCRALDVPDASQAADEISNLQRLAIAAEAKQFAPEISVKVIRYRELLDAIAQAVRVTRDESIIDAIADLQREACRHHPELATPPRGRLAMLVMEGDHSDLHYLEPYVSEDEAEALTIAQVNNGEAERAYLLRALYAAHRKIEHGAIAVPAVETLHG